MAQNIDSKTLTAEDTTHLATESEEVELVLNWKLPPRRLASTVLRAAMGLLRVSSSASAANVTQT